MLWCPSQCPFVLPLIAERTSSSSVMGGFDLRALPCRVTMSKAAGTRQHVLLRNSDRQLQLVVSGADILRPVRLRTDAIWPSKDSKHRMWALQCLNALCSDGQLPARLFPAEKRSQRLRFVVRALDGALASATHREIAEALVGEERVQADWAEPGENLRDRVRRAIRRGHALMEGGYRDFLM